MVIIYNDNAEIVNNIEDCISLLPDEIAAAIKEFYNDNIDYSVEDYKETLGEIKEVAEALRIEVKDAKKLNRNIITRSIEKIINKIVVANIGNLNV